MIGEQIQNQVETVFSVRNLTSAPLEALKRSMTSVQMPIQQTVSMLNPLTAAIGALGGGLSLMGIAKLGSQFENTQQQIAGMFQALGVTGDFNAGLVAASRTMEKIEIAAAKLPGEAEEYVQVFNAGIRSLEPIFGKNIDAMTAFSNQYTAVGKALHLDAGQLGNDLNRMLAPGRGMAGLESRTFTSMLPVLQKVYTKGQLTSEVFNRLTQRQRFDLLNTALGKFGDQIDAAGNSWDAIWGTTQSIGKMMVRLGSAGIFETMKAQLNAVNLLFMDGEGKLTEMSQTIIEIGKGIGEHIAAAAKIGVAWITAMNSVWRQFADSPTFRRIEEVFRHAGSGVTRFEAKLAGGDRRAGAMAGVGAGAAIGGAFGGLPGLIIGAVLGGVLSNFAVLGKVVERVGDLFLAIYPIIESGMALFSALSVVIGDFAVVIPPLIGALAAVLQPAVQWINALNSSWSDILSGLTPQLRELWNAVAQLVDQFGSALGSALSALVRSFSDNQSAVDLLTSSLSAAVSVLTAFTENLARGAEGINMLLRALGMKGGAQAGAGGQAALAAYLLGTQHVAGIIPGAPEGGRGNLGAPGARGGGGKTVQDFRYSRFEIQQKFDESFDPDRIAVVFSQDLQRAAERRLQSGFEPLFGV